MIMKKIFKTLLIIGVCLVLLGGSVFFVGFAIGGGKWGTLGSTQVEQKRFTETAENVLSSVKIDYENADVQIVFDENAQSVVIDYPQLQNKKGKSVSKVTVTETAGSVAISEKIDQWGLFGIWNFTSPKLTVTLPAAREFAVTVDTDNGDVSVKGDGKATSMYLETDNGDIHAKNAKVVCQGKLQMETDKGDVHLFGYATASEISVSTDNGDVEMETGTLEAKEIRMEVDNGDIDVAVLKADKISLEADNGDVEATIFGKQADYTVTVELDLGESNIRNSVGGTKTLYVSVDLGDIEIDFAE